jgi:tetratricopeptide (TPR) repeat protein/transglutaminase-like putative cysteine protease
MMMYSRVSIAGPAAILSLILLASASSPTIAQPPAEADTTSIWDREPFSVSPADALADAGSNEVDENAEVEFLWDESRYRFDEGNRKTSVAHQVYHIRRRAAIDRWGVFQTTWEPWHESRPEIRARVITPDGRELFLDPTTVEEFRLPSSDPRIFTDRYVIRAPLPGLTPGAVVETQVTTREKRPVAVSGGLVRFLFAIGVPMRRARVTVRMPEDQTLQYKLFGIDLQPQQTGEEGFREWRFESGPMAAITRIEDYLPATESGIPMLLAGTAASWSACAREYSKLVEEQLTAASELESIPAFETQKLKGASREAIIRTLSARLSKLVRYTGLEFGSSSFVPQSPQNTVSRGYGDCKDMSTLLVSQLREAGVEAHVALLSAGTGLDTVAEVPGLQNFNHAIVYVPGEPGSGTRDYWIDPTSPHTALGQLPTADQGRFALVASDETTGLIQTPRSDSKTNQWISMRRIEPSDEASFRVTERNRYRGGYATSMYSLRDQMSQSDFSNALQNVFAERYGTQDFGKWNVGQNDRLEEFSLEAELDHVQIGAIAETEAVVVLDPLEVLTKLPASFFPTQTDTQPMRRGAADQASNVRKPRESDLHVPSPSRVVVRYEIVPPNGFEPATLPDERRIEFGPGMFEFKCSSKANHTVQVEFVLDLGDGRFTAAEVRQAAPAIAELPGDQELASWNVRIRFENPSANHLVSGNVIEALRGYHQLVAQRPDDISARCDFAIALISAGLGEAARRQAQRAVEMAPENAKARRTLGNVLSHDLIGNQFFGEFSKSAATAAFEKALELDPRDDQAKWNLAFLTARDKFGAVYPTSKFAEAAAETYRELYESAPAEGSLDLVLTACHFAEQSEAFKQLLDAAEESAIRDLYQLMVLAIDRDVETVQKRLAELRPVAAERGVLTAQLIGSLVLLREYDAARALNRMLSEVAQSSGIQQQLGIGVEHLQRVDPSEWHAETPVEVCKQHLVDQMLFGIFSQNTLDNYINAPGEIAWPRITSALENVWLQRRRLLTASGATKPAVVDSISLLDFRSEGDDSSGYRVRVSMKSDPRVTGSFFVVKAHDQYRLLYPGEYDEELGKRAFALVQGQNLDGARRWLNWASDRQRGSVAMFDPFAGSPFARFWMAGDKNDPNTVALAAAMLACFSDQAEACVAKLDELREQVAGFQHLQIDRAKLQSLRRLKRNEEAATLAAQLVDQNPTAEAPFTLLAGSLLRLGRSAELIETSEKRLARLPGDHAALLNLAAAATAEGDYQRAKQAIDKMTSGKPAAMISQVLAARILLFQDGNDFENAEQTLQGLVRQLGYRDVVVVKAFAIALASNGKPSEAISILRDVRVSTGDKLDRNDRIVQAIIAEQAGLTNLAQQYYDKCEPAEFDSPVSTYQLAQIKRQRLSLEADNAEAGESIGDGN